MKRTKLTMLALAVGAIGASAQVAWNVSVGSPGFNVNVGAPPYVYVAQPPVLAIPAYNNYYYYGNGHKYNKHIKKARKYAKKAAKEARKAGWYERAVYGPNYMPAPPPHHKAKKHHR